MNRIENDSRGQGDLLRVAEVAQMLAVSKTWVYRLIERGEIGCVDMGAHAKRVPRKSLDDFLRTHFSEGSQS